MLTVGGADDSMN